MRLNKNVPEREDVITEYKHQHSTPITSDKVARKINENQKEINRRNRQRAKVMEREIARELGGIRTPMSGAAQFVKGDVSVQIGPQFYFLIECKTTSRVNNDNGPVLRLQTEWLYKIAKEATMMRCRFGVLIIKFLYHTDRFVFIPSTAYHEYFPAIEIENSTEIKRSSTPIHLEKMRIKTPLRLIHGPNMWYGINFINFKNHVAQLRNEYASD